MRPGYAGAGGWSFSILVGLTAGYLWNTTRVPEYTSTAAVLVLPTGANTTATAGGRSNAEINLDTESELVQSAKVAEAARLLLKTEESALVLRDRVTVAVPPNSQVLEITYVDNNAESTQAGAQAFAQAYLDNRASEAKRTSTPPRPCSRPARNCSKRASRRLPTRPELSRSIHRSESMRRRSATS